jgi:hypothetical protein
MNTEHGVAFWVVLSLIGLFVLRRVFSTVNISASI